MSPRDLLMRRLEQGNPDAAALVAVLRAWRNGDDGSTADRFGPDFAWPRFLRLAETHFVAPLVHECVSRNRHTLMPPAEVVQGLQMSTIDGMVNRVRAGRELQSVLGALLAEGVEPIVLKGPVLAEIAYEDPTLRSFRDLDLLFLEKEWPTARDALLSAGYQLDGQQRVLPERLTPHVGLDHWFSFTAPGGLPLECKFDPLELGLKAKDLEGFFVRSHRLRMSAGEARALSLEDQLLTLSVHLNRHGFQRLSWFVDIAGLLDRHGSQVNWDGVAARAQEEGVSVAVRHTLENVAAVMGQVAPADALSLFGWHPIAGAVWRSTWPTDVLVSFNGVHDGPIVFRKSLSPRWLVPNLMMTGRAPEKALYFARRAFPTAEYLRSRGHTSSRYLPNLAMRYISMLLAVAEGQTEDPREHLRPNDPLADDRTIVLRRPEHESPVEVSIVVATYDHGREGVLRDCLDNIVGQLSGLYELILVSNGPSPAVDEVVEQDYPLPLTILRLDTNYGHSCALNVGARHARGRILAFLDDDARPTRGWLREHLVARVVLGAVAVRGGMAPMNESNPLNGVEFGAGAAKPGPHMLDREGNMSIDRWLFLKVNGFDPLVRNSFGPELSYRLVKSGVDPDAIVLWPRALVHHDHAVDFADLVRKHYRWSRVQAGLAVSDPSIINYLRSQRSTRRAAIGSRGVLSPHTSLLRLMAALSGRIGWYVGSAKALAAKTRLS